MAPVVKVGSVGEEGDSRLVTVGNEVVAEDTVEGVLSELARLTRRARLGDAGERAAGPVPTWGNTRRPPGIPRPTSESHGCSWALEGVGRTACTQDPEGQKKFRGRGTCRRGQSVAAAGSRFWSTSELCSGWWFLRGGGSVIVGKLWPDRRVQLGLYASE